MNRLFNYLRKKSGWSFPIFFVIAGCAYLFYLRSKGFTWLNWTGFEQKTFWDMLELLIIPATLALIALIVQTSERKTDREIGIENQREVILQYYFDSITRLILNENLRGSEPDSEVRSIARSKTVSTLKRLDSNRIGALIKFLGDTNLIQKINDKSPIIGLDYLDLQNAHFKDTVMTGANLQATNLAGAVFDIVYLQNAYMFDAQLEGADLSGAELIRANLSKANLKNANLEGIDLSFANLRGAYLEGANLHNTILSSSKLEYAVLKYANLEGADLRQANMENANLEGAILTNANLVQAIMPDGREYDPSIHGIEKLTERKLKE